LAQYPAPVEPKAPWRGLVATMAVHGAASGFDAWTSWQRVERNRMLSDGGRFTAESAARKAGWFAGVTVAEVIIVKKWGKRYPWVERAFRVANLSLAGSMFSAGVHNLAMQR
jgi:hypothetical protein